MTYILILKTTGQEFKSTEFSKRIKCDTCKKIVIKSSFKAYDKQFCSDKCKNTFIEKKQKYENDKPRRAVLTEKISILEYDLNHVLKGNLAVAEKLRVMKEELRNLQTNPENTNKL